MSRLFPIETDVSWGSQGEPRVLDLDSDEADQVFSVLSADTARRILGELYEEPRTASALARELDTSLQNVDYHLGNLRDADLVEVVDTWYSEKGREMKVYAPADDAMVLFAGRSPIQRVRSLIAQVLGVVLLIGVAGLTLRASIERLFTPEPAMDDADAADADTPEMETTEDGESLESLSRSTEMTEPTLETLPLVMDPALLFFLGGLFALLVVGAWWYLQRSSAG